MKKRMIALLLSSAVSATPIAYAVAPGFYLGFMGGPATNSASDQQAQVLSPAPYPSPAVTTTASPKSQQFGSRLFMGYKINKYVGSEAGLTYFSGIRYSTKGNVQTCSSVNSRVRDFDAVVRGSFPVGNSFDVFGKGGVAIAYQTNGGALNPAAGDDCGKSTYVTKFVPTVSLGASYDLSQNWVTDLSYNNVMVGGKVGNMTMFALGISYHFVDVYCGQFLC